MTDKFVAVIFTKMDLFFDKFSIELENTSMPSSHINPKGKKIPTFNMRDCEKVNKEMRDWIEKAAPNFIETLNDTFDEKKCKFFGVSAYGRPPKSNTELADELMPHRVADPILWLLAEEEFIDKI